MEFQQLEFGGDAIDGCQLGEVDVEVGCDEGVAVFVGAWTGCEVFDGVGAQVAFQGIFFVGRAGYAAACFSSKCHCRIRAVKVKRLIQS